MFLPTLGPRIVDVPLVPWLRGCFRRCVIRIADVGVSGVGVSGFGGGGVGIGGWTLPCGELSG